MKIVIAPDAFKGTMTAEEATAAIAAGVRRVFRNAHTVQLPIADGGEGTAQAMVTATQGRLVTRRVCGPLGDQVEAAFGLYGPNAQTAIVEMAQAAGLGLVPAGRLDPRTTTTYGVGELISAAVACGATEIIVGLGGSATNDGGAGAMAALGARFLDADGNLLPQGGAALASLDRIAMDAFDFPLDAVTVTAASDVQNPLVGPNGASAVYGPQKGADASTVRELDAALRHYADIINRDLHFDVREFPGGGAAGGLGAALAAFLGAKFRPGIEIVLEAARLDEHLHGADWVFTGEGRMDSQTLSGKAIHGLLSHCRAAGVPVIAFAGSVESGAVDALQALGLHSVVPLVAGQVTREQALASPTLTLENAVARTMAALPLNQAAEHTASIHTAAADRLS